MGFMDKVKEQAAVASSIAKDAASKGQTKLDEAQAKRAADATLRQLGLAGFLQATDRGTEQSDAEIASYIDTLKAYETEYGSLGGTTPSV